MSRALNEELQTQEAPSLTLDDLQATVLAVMAAEDRSAARRNENRETISGENLNDPEKLKTFLLNGYKQTNLNYLLALDAFGELPFRARASEAQLILARCKALDRVFFDLKGSQFYIRDSQRCWRPQTEEAVRTFIRIMGAPDEPRASRNGVSDLDIVMLWLCGEGAVPLTKSVRERIEADFAFDKRTRDKTLNWRKWVGGVPLNRIRCVCSWEWFADAVKKNMREEEKFAAEAKLQRQKEEEETRLRNAEIQARLHRSMRAPWRSEKKQEVEVQNG